MRVMRLASSVVLCLASVLGCSSEKASTGGGGSGSSTQTSTALATTGTSDGGGSGGTGGARPTPPALPIIPNHGGPIIEHPEVISITWQGDPIAADLLAFDDWMVASPFFATLMAEWGVGSGTHGGAFSLTNPAPASLDDAAIRQIIQSAITDGSVPPANGSRIYTIYPPAGTKVTNFGEGCVAFQAYHSAFTANLPGGATALAVYAVTPRCANTGNMTATDYTTWGQSHEVMEASSDPNPNDLAWVVTKQTSNTPELGENADFCTSNATKIDGHVVTRNYSNVAAMAGQRPCVPAPDGPMFGAFSADGSVTLKNGESETVPIYLYATATLPAFTVDALPLDPNITATLDKSSGVDGDVLSLTVTTASNYIEIPGSNLIELASISDGYPTFRFVVVHRQK